MMDVINSQMLYGGIDVTDYAALSFGCIKIFWGQLPLVCQLSLTPPLPPRKRTTVPTAEEIKQPLKSDDGENGDILINIINIMFISVTHM